MVRAKHPLLIGEDLVNEGLGLAEAARVVIDAGEVAPRGKLAKMIRAKRRWVPTSTCSNIGMASPRRPATWCC